MKKLILLAVAAIFAVGANAQARRYTDVSLPGTDGKTVTLSSVVDKQGNKYVLLDFWATWCGPCMGEVPYLTEAYAKYHDRGFEIYGVSLDSNADHWRKVVDKRGMNWVQVIQLQESGMKATNDYSVRAIPSNFLIDTATGKIIAVNLRGEALGRKLAELLD